MKPKKDNSGLPDERGRRRSLILIAASVLVLVVLGLTGIGAMLVRSFMLLERDQIGQRALQVQAALKADLRQLDVSNRDYADWNDAVAFLSSRSQAFIDANFTDETLSGMRVDVVWMIDAQGHEVYSCFHDRRTHRVITPAPALYTGALQQELRRHPAGAQLQPWDVVLRSPSGPLSIAMREIRRTDGSSPTGVRLVFARAIAETELQRVRDTTQLPVRLTPLDQPKATADLPPGVRRWLSHADSGTFVAALSGAEIAGYALVRDSHSRPLALLSFEQPRSVFATGVKVTAYLLAGMLGLICVATGAIAWFVIRNRRILAEQRAAELRYRVIGQQLQEAVVLADAETLRIVEANDVACRALDCESGALSSRSVTEVFPDLDMGRVRELARQDRAGNLASRVRLKGEWTEAEVSATYASIDGRRVLVFVGHDVSHRREAVERERDNRRKLLRAAQHDALTGLPNRAFLTLRLPKVLQKVEKGRRLLAVFYGDIDHFKTINDSEGHPEGDQLLRRIAARLRAAVGAQDLVARIGGDEFVIVAPLMADREAIETLAVRMRTTVAAPLILGTKTVAVSMSLGIAVCPEDGLDAETLLKRADMALYSAKAAGRNCHRFFAAEMADSLNLEAVLHQALQTAIRTEQIVVEFQPIVELASGRVTSFEALVRWQHPERGRIPPDQFIPIAERTGLIVALGEQVLELVLRHLREWQDCGLQLLPIAVNVSPLQLDQSDFPAVVKRLAHQAGMEMKWLRFEVTECALMKDRKRLIGILESLRQLGTQILIDDFGTGYSSLSYVDELPADILKIDRAFVRDLGQDVARLPIINAVIDMAHQLRIKTVAEGVETPEQAMILMELGCEYGQGYFYSKPLAAIACKALLQELTRSALTPTMLVRALQISSGEVGKAPAPPAARPAVPGRSAKAGVTSSRLRRLSSTALTRLRRRG